MAFYNKNYKNVLIKLSLIYIKIRSTIMLAIDYSKIPMDEKFMMLENLWADMTKKVNEVLDDREEKLKNGTSKFYDLEDIK